MYFIEFYHEHGSTIVIEHSKQVADAVMTSLFMQSDRIYLAIMTGPF